MLQGIKQLYGNKLGASDGDIGHVKDFFFDDQNWAIRYVVADTGSWLPGDRCSSPRMPLTIFHQCRKSPCRESDPETN